MEMANDGKAYKSIAYQNILGSCVKKSKTLKIMSGLTLSDVIPLSLKIKTFIILHCLNLLCRCCNIY
jgi:hypothetical protein